MTTTNTATLRLAPLGLPRARQEFARRTLLDGPVRFPADELGELNTRPTLDEHLAMYGPRAPRYPSDPDVLIDLLAEIGLTGRGGGHFPAATKWQAVRDATRRTGVLPVLVANAAEGEPASAKDAALLSQRPHLVLDGVAAAAECVGATEAVLWLHGDAHKLHRVLTHALHERRSAGTVEPSMRLASGPGRYLSGESSAVIRALSGGPTLPEFTRELAAVSGVHGRPTLLHNVETLARVALLSSTGVADHRPTSLVTVLAGGQRTVLELDPSCRVRDAARLGGWPVDTEPQAVLVGGYGGSWLPWDQAADLPLHQPAFRAAGVSLGAGILALLPQGTCGLAETARIANYMTDSSARQCGPCLFGLSAISGSVTDLWRGTARRNEIRRLQRWASEVAGRGACNHPDGVVRMVLSALVTFADDVEAHRRRRPCDGAGAPGLLPVPSETS